MKAPTKNEFKVLLQQEIQSWKASSELLDGIMKEQAIGRLEQCKWLLQVFEGNLAIPHFEEKSSPVILESKSNKEANTWLGN